MVERAEIERATITSGAILGNLGEIASGNPHDIAKATGRAPIEPNRVARR